MPVNPYEKYKSNSINTATKEELTLMLYEGAIKFCNLAIASVNEKKYPLAHDNIIKVQNIIREFQITLDNKYPIAENFNAMYDYMYRRLVEANVKKDVAILEEVRDFLREFRDMWKEAMVLAKKNPKGEAPKAETPKTETPKAETPKSTPKSAPKTTPKS